MTNRTLLIGATCVRVRQCDDTLVTVTIGAGDIVILMCDGGRRDGCWFMAREAHSIRSFAVICRQRSHTAGAVARTAHLFAPAGVVRDLGNLDRRLLMANRAHCVCALCVIRGQRDHFVIAMTEGTGLMPFEFVTDQRDGSSRVVADHTHFVRAVGMVRGQCDHLAIAVTGRAARGRIKVVRNRGHIMGHFRVTGAAY